MKIQQQNEEHRYMKICIKNKQQQQQQQQHKNLTGGSTKQSTIDGSFWLLILKNDYKKVLYKKFIKKFTTIVNINSVVI